MSKRNPLAGEAIGGQFGLAPMSTGDFLSTDSTLARMREPSTSLLLERSVREDWEAAGSPFFSGGACAVMRAC